MLFTLIRLGLQQSDVKFDLQPLTSEQWQALYTTARQQCLGAVVMDGIRRLPPELQPKWGTYNVLLLETEKCEQHYNNTCRTIHQLLQLFNSHGIPTLIVKGLSLAQYYPTPSHRTSTDIDTYHFGREAEAEQLVEEHLNIAVEKSDENHHNRYTINGILVESHFRFLESNHYDSNEAFNDLLTQEAQQSRRVKIGDEPCLVGSPTFIALHLMHHMVEHFILYGCNLRQLCDWMLFVQAEHDHLDWERLYRIFEQHNMLRFVHAINGILITRMGMQPQWLPSYESDPKLEERILQDTLCPQFSKEACPSAPLARACYQLRILIANRWKHRITHSESYWKNLLHRFSKRLRSDAFQS